ncbi:phage portal protein [Megalodesulfovibrio paquesii]
MTREDLLQVHPQHAAMAPRWRFWIAAYEGLDALLAHGVLGRHPREQLHEFEDRLREAVGFNYCRSIVNCFNFYLFEKQPRRELGLLAEDPLWRTFASDCDLYGTDYDNFLLEQQKYASIFGHVGILVDKPGRGAATRQEEREARLHPYLAAYHPEAILDWRWERDANHRPFLAMVKLLEEDGTVLVYRTDGWERWRVEEGAELIGAGGHGLGRVPFVWLMNLTGRERCIGVSDIADVAPLDASIIRDLSLGGEVIKNCAFPMFRTPRQPPDATGLREEVATGPRAVLEWDPEAGAEARPDWLQAAAREPVEAILLWVERKTQEIYRMSNAGGLHGVDTQAKSGVALRQEFQLLNAVLASKAANLEEAERAILGHWLAWQGRGRDVEQMRLERPRHFSVEDLAADLDNAIKGAGFIESPTFQRELKMSLARRLLPGGEGVLGSVREELEQAPAGSVGEG